MAITHKRLSAIGEQVVGPSTPETVYVPTDDFNGLVKTIILHNTHTTNVTVTLYHLTEAGTAATANIFLKVILIPDETFEMSVGHIFAVADEHTIEAMADVTNVVNCFIFGAEEPV